MVSFSVYGLQQRLTPRPVWAEAGGIIGRGILLDHRAWAETQGIQPDPFSTSKIPLSELLAVANRQKTTFQPGDILFVRTGYMKAYDALSAAESKELATLVSPPSIGLEPSEEILRWIWDSGFVAVAGDNPAFEAWPCKDKRYWLHEWLLAGWGLPIGELFDLEKLAMECEKAQKWTFFFSSVPLKVRRSAKIYCT